MGKTKRPDRIEVFEGKRTKRNAYIPRGWYFHRVAPNGEIVASSEAYTRKDSAVRGARRTHPGLAIMVVS